MKKNAYAKMMGLQKKAAQPVPSKPEGYFDNLKRVYNTAVAAGKDKPGEIMRGIGDAYSAPGELGTWAYIWNLIKSWFGSKEGAAAIKAHDQRSQGITKAHDRLSNYYKGISQHLKSQQDKDKLASILLDTSKRYANRGVQARSKAADIFSKLPKGTKTKEADLYNYYFGRGEQNAKQDVAPKGKLTVPNATAQEMKQIQPAGRDMAKIKVPSYKSQLMGDTAVV